MSVIFSATLLITWGKMTCACSTTQMDSSAGVEGSTKKKSHLTGKWDFLCRTHICVKVQEKLKKKMIKTDHCDLPANLFPIQWPWLCPKWLPVCYLVHFICSLPLYLSVWYLSLKFSHSKVPSRIPTIKLKKRVYMLCVWVISDTARVFVLNRWNWKTSIVS